MGACEGCKIESEIRSLVLFRADSSIRIRNPDRKLSSPLHQSLPVLSRHPTSNFCTVDLVGHHELGGSSGSITNVGHLVHSLELATNSVVNTLGAPPVTLKFVISVRLMPGELLRPFLDNLWPTGRGKRHGGVLHSLVEVNQAIIAW